MWAHLVLVSALLGVSTADLECYEGTKISKGTPPPAKSKCASGTTQCFKEFSASLTKKSTYTYGCDVGETVCGSLVNSCDKKKPTKCCCSTDSCNLNPEGTLPHTSPASTTTTGTTAMGTSTSVQKTTVSITQLECYIDQRLTREQAPRKLRNCNGSSTSCLRQVKPNLLEGGMNYDYSCDSLNICEDHGLIYGNVSCTSDNSICCCRQSGCNNLDLHIDPSPVVPTLSTLPTTTTVPTTTPVLPATTTVPTTTPVLPTTTTVPTTVPTKKRPSSTLASSSPAPATTTTRPASKIAIFALTTLTFIYGML